MRMRMRMRMRRGEEQEEEEKEEEEEDVVAAVVVVGGWRQRRHAAILHLASSHSVIIATLCKALQIRILIVVLLSIMASTLPFLPSR